MWLTLLFSTIITLFWQNEWRYSLPTPIPANYKLVAKGEKIHLPGQLHYSNNKPLFLHFFNPECPCSRFNLEHFKSLLKQYDNEVNFAMILVSNKKFTAEKIRSKYDVDIPVFVNTDIAARCGVYSTPQAVIIDTAGMLFYRGNYNRARYCTDKETEYARIALMALLNKRSVTRFDRYALTAYGCELPKCNKP